MTDNIAKIAKQSKGLMASFSALTTVILATVYTRLNLLSLDIEEAIAHLLSLLMLSLVALYCFFVTVLLLATFLVVTFWETHRLLTLGLLAGCFLMAGVATYWYVLHKIRTTPRLFSVSLFELLKDWKSINLR